MFLSQLRSSCRRRSLGGFVKRVAEYLEAFDVIETFKKMIAYKAQQILKFVGLPL
jgi:hypothetical protein